MSIQSSSPQIASVDASAPFPATRDVAIPASLDRRQFISSVAKIPVALALAPAASQLLADEMHEQSATRTIDRHGVSVTIPLPIQMVIDDVGWWVGPDGSSRQEPYRSGISRDHVTADYEALVHLARTLGIRPQIAMALCEWDTDNILRKLPTSTWMGEDWDNRPLIKRVGSQLDEAAQILRDNQRHLEITIHAIGHEYWTAGKFTRAEWADIHGVMRPPDQVAAHLDFFGQLMDQHDLGPLPDSFVPTAFLHTFGPSGEHKESFATIARRQGVKYINTLFRSMRNVEAVQHGLFGFDGDVMTVDRGPEIECLERNDSVSDQGRYLGGTISTRPAGTLTGPTCGIHWANVLHIDPRRNLEIVDGWVKFLQAHHDRFDMILAPDSNAFRRQLAHCQCTRLAFRDKVIDFSFTAVDHLPQTVNKDSFTIKVKGSRKLAFESFGIDIASTDSKVKDGSHFHVLELRRDANQSQARLVMSELS